jgi:hypothetical protein
MDEIKKMLRAVINGQSALRDELTGKFDSIRHGMEKGFADAKVHADDIEKRLTARIDRIGKQVAYLEDDAPTREEHEMLEKRVAKVEKKLASL